MIRNEIEVDTIGFQRVGVKSTPSGTIWITAGINRLISEDRWSYSSIVDILVYLGGDYHIDITMAVYQCDNYWYILYHSHKRSLKHIFHFWIGTKNCHTGREGLSRDDHWSHGWSKLWQIQWCNFFLNVGVSWWPGL